MKSPQSRAHKEKKVSYRRREHKNKTFYNSKTWRDTREAYMRHYEQLLFNECIKDRKWNGDDLTPEQATYLASLRALPCEMCLKHYIAEAYDSVEEGKELDHIDPVNPKNALERVLTGATAVGSKGDIIEVVHNHMYGDPFEFNNLQLLCKRHHAKKSQREKG